MLVSKFDYHLPKELIAQKSVRPRDSSRLLVYDRKTSRICHQHFYDLPKFLKKGDLLVFNDTKVFRARLFGRLQVTGYGLQDKKVEVFLLKPLMPLKPLKSLKTLKNSEWEVLAKPGRKLAVGAQVVFAKDFWCEVLEKKFDGRLIIRFNKSANQVIKLTDKFGHIPVPPYIKIEPSQLSDYQTIYAKHLGSVAAPTAGFHFTPSLIKKLKKMGVKTAFVTLHVGLSTFQPVKTEKVEEHQMHSEWVEISAPTAAAINQAKKEGRRVIAVGTTTVRALEGSFIKTLKHKNTATLKHLNTQTQKQFNHFPPKADPPLAETIKPFNGEINIFITPGFKFKIIDVLITNFHLPQSTLLMLVSAFAGRQKILRAYQQAVQRNYRFFSFGDAMLII